jgi:multiple sugar transport system substrate-binding protein
LHFVVTKNGISYNSAVAQPMRRPVQCRQALTEADKTREDPMSNFNRGLCIVALLAVCGIAAGTSSAQATGDCTEVRVMVTAGPEEDVLIKYANSDFAKQSGIKPSIDTVSRDLWPSRAAREFTGDKASYDLVALNPSEGDPVWVARAKSIDLRKILPPNVIANLLPKLVEAANYNDKLVGVPQYWNTEMYFYRKDLFADAKNQADFKAKYGYALAPPETWDQLADIDDFFHRAPTLFGGWMSGVNWGIGLDYQTILFGLGGRAFDLKNNVLLANSPESVKAFQLMQRIAKTAPDSFSTQSFFDADTLMLGGKLASYTNYSYAWAKLSKQPDKYGIKVLPGAGNPVGTFYFAVPESAPNPACAAKFLTWMLSDDYQAKQVADTFNPPATISQMSNPAVTKLIPNFEEFVAAAAKLTPVEVTWGPEFYEGVSAAGADVYAGKKTPQEAADWLQNTKFKGRKPVE